MAVTENLHVYPAPIVNESRIFKQTAALEQADIASAITICGTATNELPRIEELSARRRIERVGRPESERPLGVFARVWRQMTWARAVYRTYSRRDIRVINAHSVAVLPVCYALSRRTNSYLVYDTHELETETVASRGLQRRIFKLAERLLIRKCDLVLTVNDSIAAWYKSAYPGISPVSVRNVPEIAEMETPDLRGRLGVPGQSLLYSHVGRITYGRNIEQILSAFAAIDSGPHIVFIGDGPLRPLVEEYVLSHSQIHWIPSVPSEQVVGYVRGSDAGLCLIEPSCLSYELSLPNKAFEYAVAGKPFLYTPLPEIQRLVGDLLPEWSVNEPKQDLLSKLKLIDATKVLDAEGGLRARSWPTWSTEVARMLAAYERILGDRSKAESK